MITPQIKLKNKNSPNITHWKKCFKEMGGTKFHSQKSEPISIKFPSGSAIMEERIF